MRIATAQKFAFLALLLIFGMFVASTDARCGYLKNKDKKKDHDMDVDMDRDMDRDDDCDFDDDDSDKDDFKPIKDKDEKDKDEKDKDEKDKDEKDKDEKDKDEKDKDDKDGKTNNGNGPPGGDCDTDADCKNPKTPFCGEGKCRGCNFFFDGEDKTDANAKCAAVDEKKNVCNVNGHCGKDHTANKNASKDKKDKKFKPDKLDEELGAIADEAFGDDEIASDDTEEIMDNLMESFANSTEEISSKDDLKTFAKSLRNVTKNKDHFNGDGAKKAREAVEDMLTKAKDLDGEIDEETRDNVGNSLSDAISGAKKGLTKEEKKAELGKADKNMRDFAKLSARGLALGHNIVVSTDECEVKVKRVKKDKLADDDCDPATDDTCVKFPAVIVDIEGCDGANSAVDIEVLKKEYNANESDDGTTSENSTEINLVCTDTSNDSTENMEVEGLSEDLKFSLPLADGETCQTDCCVFWDEDAEDWSSEGCTSKVDGDVIECSCNHLTEFAAAYGEEQDDDESSSASALFVMPFLAILAIFAL